MDVAMLVLRLVVGLALAAHGAQKLFGWFNGPGIQGFAGFLESMGFRRAKGFAVLAGTAEFAGGLLLALGLLTPLAAAAAIGMMVAAAVLVHRTNGFFTADGGWELNAIIGTAAAAIAIAGPGAYALDAVFELGMTGPVWAGAAIILGVLAAGVVVALRGMGQRQTVGNGSPSPTA